MKNYICEFIGTFFLVLTVGMTVLSPLNAGLFAPLAIGTALAVMVYATAHISGGHLNPAVSFAVFLRGKLSSNHLFRYWAAQLLAGIVAGGFVIYLKGGMPQVPMRLDIVKAFIGEFLFTFALCFVVLNVATAKETKGNSYFGWAIGLTVMFGAYAVGAVSAGAFNPAVAIGLSVMHFSAWINLWIYIVASLFAAYVAALVFNVLHAHKEQKG